MRKRVELHPISNEKTSVRASTRLSVCTFALVLCKRDPSRSFRSFCAFFFIPFYQQSTPSLCWTLHSAVSTIRTHVPPLCSFLCCLVQLSSAKLLLQFFLCRSLLSPFLAVLPCVIPSASFRLLMTFSVLMYTYPFVCVLVGVCMYVCMCGLGV